MFGVSALLLVKWALFRTNFSLASFVYIHVIHMYNNIYTAGIPPDVGSAAKKAGGLAEDIPDYQDSLRKYAMGLAENKGDEGEISGAEKDERRKEGEGDQEKGNKAGEVISRPQQRDSKPQLQRPPHSYPPHMMHSGMQNGYPSEADMARMHSPYPPPPPHAYPPPPYGPRQFDPQHRNGMPSPASHHPAYPPYYAHPHRMPYGPPHPYMPGGFILE